MRVLELEIHNVRGISHLLLKPDGKNFVVWGPNGSGKSAVVDAIDFLLTGRVSRLTGKGTSGITLNKHGPHVDHTSAEATVRAIVKLPDVPTPIEIKRCMAYTNTLECDNSTAPHLKSIMALARRGQHVLTRRDILKYITEEAGTRAQEIQKILNITEIEDTRKALVRVQNDFGKDFQAARSNVSMARGGVNSTVQENTYREDTIIKVVNKNRKVLGGSPISPLRSTELKKGLKAPTVISDGRADKVTLLERDIQNLVNVTLARNKAQIAKNDEQLRALIATIRSDPQLLHALSHLQLTELGMELIDETGCCPLCGASWPPFTLREYLEKRLSTAQIAAQYMERITELSTTISESVNTTIVSLQKVIAANLIADNETESQQLQSWLSNLQNLAAALGSVLEKYPDPRFDMNHVQQMLAPADIVQTLSHINSIIKSRYPEITIEQTSWDTLTRFEENLKALEKAEKNLKSAELNYRRACILMVSFLNARDNILGNLYEDIKNRFVSLYRQLHGIDEEKFTAKIEPEGAGLSFEVDFYGRGTHPPQALHSEGHQESPAGQFKVSVKLQ